MQIKWLEEAVSDLCEIREYIAKDKPLAAQRVAIRIRESVEKLEEHPGMGRAGRVEGTRELVIDNLPFIIPYRVKNNRIEILRVLHTARQRQAP